MQGPDIMRSNAGGLLCRRLGHVCRCNKPVASVAAAAGRAATRRLPSRLLLQYEYWEDAVVVELWP